MGEAAPKAALADTVMTGHDSSILDEIRSLGVAAAIWERTPPRPFQDWIDTLPPSALPEARLVLSPHQVEDAIGSICVERGIPGGPHRDALTRDIALLATQFSRIMAVPLMHLRLDVVKDNACRRFHLDNVPARLLCTYRGRGTEYGRSLAGEEPGSIDHVSTGSVALFRGRLWSRSEHSVIVHRSPQISGLGENRLLLVLDAAVEDD